MDYKKEMYSSLFNGITEAFEKLDEISLFLKDLQLKSEQLFIETDLQKQNNI